MKRGALIVGLSSVLALAVAEGLRFQADSQVPQRCSETGGGTMRDSVSAQRLLKMAAQSRAVTDSAILLLVRANEPSLGTMSGEFAKGPFYQSAAEIAQAAVALDGGNPDILIFAAEVTFRAAEIEYVRFDTLQLAVANRYLSCVNAALRPDDPRATKASSLQARISDFWEQRRLKGR